MPHSYQLPDVQASLTDEQKNSLVSICGMGFPVPRVARALKEFNGDDSKVIICVCACVCVHVCVQVHLHAHMKCNVLWL